MPSASTTTNPRGYVIAFDEASHTYTTEYGDGNVRKYTSGTSFIHRFFPKFDADGAIAERKAHQRGVSVDQIRFEWKQNAAVACEMGTRVHETCEDVLHNRLDEHGNWAFRNKPKDEREQKIMAAGFQAAMQVRNTMQVLGVEQVVFDFGVQIAGTIDLLTRDKDGVVWVLDWKGLALDTPIFTVAGWKTMDTIRVGDVVYDKDGCETKVVHTSAVHHNPCYEIVFDNGDSLVADHEHRWLITFWRGRGKSIQKVMTTEEIAAHLDSHARTSYVIPRIANPLPIDGRKASLPIDPYTFGVWLGDGSKSCGVITNPSDAIFARIASFGWTIGPNLSHDGSCPMRTVYGLSGKLRKLGLIDNKHIPQEYLTCDAESRWLLLQGFMDADGYFDKDRKRYSTETTHDNQLRFVTELLASLGIKYSVFKVMKSCNGKRVQAWSVNFTCGRNPFLARNAGASIGRNDNHSFRGIVSVKRVDTVPTRCIEVDSPTHTFLCGRQMIVTHNTNKSIDLHNNYPQDNRGLSPVEHLENCNFFHYALQLNLYQFLLVYAGYLPRGTKFRRGIFHLTPEGPKFYELPDLQTEVRDMVITTLEQPPF